MNRYWIKIDRLSAWVLFASMLVYFITGYGMTKGIISREFSSNMHLNLLPIVVLFAFTFHTSYAIHLAFRRWRIWNSFSAVVLVLFFVAFLASFLYIDWFYQPEAKSVSNSAASATTARGLASSFTAAELAKYDGQNGRPSYVAIDGQVYDVTAVFQSGFHFGHFAGRNLTGEFYSEHVKSAISKYPVVGIFTQ